MIIFTLIPVLIKNLFALMLEFNSLKVSLCDLEEKPGGNGELEGISHQ